MTSNTQADTLGFGKSRRKGLLVKFFGCCVLMLGSGIQGCGGETEAVSKPAPPPSVQLRYGERNCPDVCNVDMCGESQCKFCEFACTGKCPSRENTVTSVGQEAPFPGACQRRLFRNVTEQLLPFADGWDAFPSPARPIHPETSPAFVDINNDGIPDWLTASHQPSVEVGLSIKETSDASSKMKYRRHSVRFGAGKNGDPHGHSVIDLDRDGHLDVFIVGGGGKGGKKPGSGNQLYWGGGRNDVLKQIRVAARGFDTALAAGLSNAPARSRHSFAVDVNQDGHTDVLLSADRPRKDYLVPGSMMLGRGERTWEQTNTVLEYSKSLMVTDVDGDGFAQELVITRDHCWPQKKPPYTQETRAFCSTRPVGTTAVYKFDKASQIIKSIGKQYLNAVPDVSRQPGCCPTGKGDTFNANNKDCFVNSVGTADIDGDEIADQVFLYCGKVLFYLSSDRPLGELPFGRRYLSAEVVLPLECDGAALRIFDMDNDGELDYLVACHQPGIFVELSAGGNYRSWRATTQCGAYEALSQIEQALPTPEEVALACSNGKGTNIERILCKTGLNNLKTLRRGVKVNKKKGEEMFRFAGISQVDFNNDGYYDFVVAYKQGRLQFFENTASVASDAPNRFISFQLIDAKSGLTTPRSVGTTLILYSKDCEGCKTQFREINSFQSAPDKRGYIDDRIIFGLGVSGKPVKLLLRTGIGVERTVDLRGWKFSPQHKPLRINL